jgi:hypothetical protein
MKLANVDPTVVTFGCLLNACRIGVADENASCAESDLRRGTHEAGSNARTTATGTNTFVTGTNLEPTKCSIAVTRAYDLLQQMQTYNICPNDRCQNALVRVIAEAGRVDDALDEVKKISRKGGRFERATLEGVVVALCLGGYAERGLRIVGWMSVRGFVPCAATYRQLTRSLCAEGEGTYLYFISKIPPPCLPVCPYTRLTLFFIDRKCARRGPRISTPASSLAGRTNWTKPRPPR